MITLTWLDLALAFVLILALSATVAWLGVRGVNRDLLWAAGRTVVQLLVMGWALKFLFARDGWGWVAAFSLFMVLAAGYEISQRQKQRFRGWAGYGLGTLSITLSSFVMTGLALLVVIQADPWFSPQYAIPLLGMLLGNTMNGIALSLNHLTLNAHRSREVILTRLSLGQPWWETVAELRRDSIQTGLIPIINAMAAAGIISLPGMMTGQILAGASPLEAVKYQILIMFLIAAGTGFGTVTAVYLASARLFDHRHRLCLERLQGY